MSAGGLLAGLGRRLVPLVVPAYIALLLLPIAWLATLSFKTTREITASFTWLPRDPTLRHYATIFGDPAWYMGYVNALTYVLLNVALCLLVAVPAAYAFSRRRFLGDRQLFFWLLAVRMTPPAILLVPVFQLYSDFGLIDTHIAVALAHCLFNVPIAIWILESFISSIPKEIDETARLDGYPLHRFFARILIPMIAPGLGVAAFFCFLFSWVELLLASALTTIDAKPIGAIMSRAGGALGFVDLGLIAAVSVLAILPGTLMITFVRRHIARGFALGQVK